MERVKFLPVPAIKAPPIEYADERAMGMMLLMGYTVEKDIFDQYVVVDPDGNQDRISFGSEKFAWATLWSHLKELP